MSRNPAAPYWARPEHFLSFQHACPAPRPRLMKCPVLGSASKQTFVPPCTCPCQLVTWHPLGLPPGMECKIIVKLQKIPLASFQIGEYFTRVSGAPRHGSFSFADKGGGRWVFQNSCSAVYPCLFQ